MQQFNEHSSSLYASMETLFKTYGSKDESKMQNNVKRIWAHICSKQTTADNMLLCVFKKANTQRKDF